MYFFCVNLSVLFDMLDRDNDGKLSAADLAEGFKHVMMEYLHDTDVSEIATQTIKFAD